MTEPKRPSLEIRIPISPTPRYMRMVRLLYESIQRNGGETARAACYVLSVSPEPTTLNLADELAWAPPGTFTVRWVEQGLFERLEYDGTGLDRYFVESDADLVAMFDADLFVAGDFDQILHRSFESSSLLGFIAHVSPFREYPLFPDSQAWWTHVFERAGLSAPQFDHEHTGWGVMCRRPEHRYCPPYFNYGVVVAPREATEAIGRLMESYISTVDRCLETFFKSQIALTLAIQALGVPIGLLGIRDNFPLHVDPDGIRSLNPDPEGKNRDEDVRIFHYLGGGAINKNHFDSIEGLRQTLLRPNHHSAARCCAQRMMEVLQAMP